MASPVKTKRDLVAWVLYAAKPLQHKEILEVSTSWVDENFPHVETEAKKKFVWQFTKELVKKLTGDRNKGRFLTLNKHQPYLNEIIQLQTDEDQPSPPKIMKLSAEDEIEFMRRGIAFFKPRGDDAL